MSGQGREWELTREALDGLLAQLDTDRERAAAKYEEIRQRLIRLFMWRGSQIPEELADETINRVARKVLAGVEIRAEDPFVYFSRVAFLIFKEVLRRDERQRRGLEKAGASVMATAEDADNAREEARLRCLESCLDQLEADPRALILEFYQGEKSQRIKRRKTLAARLRMSVNALRVRAHRLRARLEECVVACLAAVELGD